MSALKELLEKATPGPWSIVRHASTAVENHNRELVASTGVRSDNRVDPDVLCAELEANAQLIARLNPQTMALVLEALEDTISKINDAAAGNINFRDDLAYQLELALNALNNPSP